MFFLLAAVVLAAFHLVGWWWLGAFALDLGSVLAPTPRYLMFIQFWIPFGAVASLALAYALVANGNPVPRVVGIMMRPPTRAFLAWSVVVGVLIPCFIRYFVILNAPLTDDEGVYRLASQLIASGRLSVPSPPLKLFFDQNFLINDGRLYPAYFLGWPSVLAIGTLTGVPWLINPVLSALTIPALARLVSSLAGERFVRTGVVLFLASPFIQVAAATYLSHTSCLASLTWSYWCYFSFRERRTWQHLAGCGCFLALAFCIRPQAVLPIGGPLVLAVASEVTRVRGEGSVRHALGFAVPVVALAVLFLLVLQAQTGSPFVTGYRRYGEYLIANGFQFTTFNASDLTTVVGYPAMGVRDVIARILSAVVRLNSDLFGWPCSLILLSCAVRTRRPGSHLIWSSLLLGFVALVLQRDLGVDTFGPVHGFELALPIIILTMVGVANVDRSDRLWSTRRHQQQYHAALCFVLASIVVSIGGFVPVRFVAIHQIAARIDMALGVAVDRGLHNAIVFAPFPFVPMCSEGPAHFVFFRPPNDPNFTNDVLWVNHVDDHADMQLLATFPGRTGVVMQWSPSCKPTLRTLTAAPS